MMLLVHLLHRLLLNEPFAHSFVLCKEEQTQTVLSIDQVMCEVKQVLGGCTVHSNLCITEGRTGFCGVLRCFAMFFNVFQCFAMFFDVFRCFSMFCSP